MKYHNKIAQGSQEWIQLRAGKVGGSESAPFTPGSIPINRDCCKACNSVSIRFRKTTKDFFCNTCKEVADVIKYGDSQKYNTLSEGLETLLYKKVGQRITGEIDDTFTGNAATERGQALEPIAIQEYAKRKFISGSEIGYISNGDLFGFSPDWLIAKDGILEVKCPGAAEFVRYSKTRIIKPQYISQMQWGLFHSDRKYYDFAVFHPSPKFKENLIITRVFPDPVWFAHLQRMTKIYEKDFCSLLKLLS